MPTSEAVAAAAAAAGAPATAAAAAGAGGRKELRERKNCFPLLLSSLRLTGAGILAILLDSQFIPDSSSNSFVFPLPWLLIPTLPPSFPGLSLRAKLLNRIASRAVWAEQRLPVSQSV